MNGQDVTDDDMLLLGLLHTYPDGSAQRWQHIQSEFNASAKVRQEGLQWFKRRAKKLQSLAATSTSQDSSALQLHRQDPHVGHSIPMVYEDKKVRLGPSIVAPGQRGVLAKRNFRAGDVVLSDDAFVVGWPNEPELPNPNALLEDPAVPSSAADAFYTHCAENGLIAAVGVAHCFLKLYRAFLDEQLEGFNRIFDLFEQFRCSRCDVIDPSRDKALKLLRLCFVKASDIPGFTDILSEASFSKWLGMWNLYNQTGGLFLIESHFNHSCRPHVKAKHSKFPVIEMKAVRPILAGEEICTTYVNPAWDRKQRREELRKYGFDCMCDRCVKDMQLRELPKEEVMRLLL